MLIVERIFDFKQIKIVVIHKPGFNFTDFINTFQVNSKGSTVSGLTSPRYIQFINETKAYVSDIYSRSMTIIDPKTFEETGYITIGNSTEQMVKHGDFVYVTSWYRHNKIYKIDVRTDEVTDSLSVKKQPKQHRT